MSILWPGKARREGQKEPVLFVGLLFVLRAPTNGQDAKERRGDGVTYVEVPEVAFANIVGLLARIIVDECPEDPPKDECRDCGSCPECYRWAAKQLQEQLMDLYRVSRDRDGIAEVMVEVAGLFIEEEAE